MIFNVSMILLILFGCLSYKFEERLPIKKEQCSVEIQQIKYDLVFFTKLEVVQTYKLKVGELDIFSSKLTVFLDDFMKPGKLLLEIIEKPKIQSLEVLKYDENLDPDDIEAMKYYQILVEFEKTYQKIIDSNGAGFIKMITWNAKNFKEKLKKLHAIFVQLEGYSTNDIQKELVQLQRDHKTCTGQQFQLLQHQIKLKDEKNKTKKTQKKNKSNKKQHHAPITQKFVTQFISWEYVEYEPVKKEECGQYMEEIEQDFLEFLKIQELVKYKENQQVYTNSVNELYGQKEDYVQLAKMISKAKNSLRFDDSILIKDGFTQYIRMRYDNQYKGQNKDYSLANDAIIMLDQTYYDLNELKVTFDKSSVILGVDIETFEQLKQKNEVLNSYLNTQFAYQDVEVYHELLQINRDYKICEGKKNYQTYILKINKQLVTKPKNEYILDPPIQKQNCQKQLPDIKENILYYLKLNVVKQFGLLITHYEEIMKDLNSQQTNILKNNKQLNEFFNSLDLQGTVTYIQQILPNNNPDDLNVIKAYDNLNNINDYLSSLKKYFLEAKPFLEITEDEFKTLNKQFNELKNIIDYNKYKDQNIQKELLESLRDYSICTDKDFLKEYNLEIQDRSQDILSYSFNKDKNKSIKPVYSTNLLQLKEDWKYYEYPPIQIQECMAELKMINEDILQFQKVQVLNRYKTNNQKCYDDLIEKVLKFKEQFLINTKQGMDLISKLDFTKRLRFFNDYPKNKNDLNTEILNGFDKIHEYINNLGTFDKKQSAAIFLYQYEENDFKKIQQSHLLLNDYLNNRFKYNMNEVELELRQLYRDYKICNGRSYYDDNQDQRHHIHTSPDRGMPIVITRPITRPQVDQKGMKLNKKNKLLNHVLKQNPKHKQKKNNKQKHQQKQSDK